MHMPEPHTSPVDAESAGVGKGLGICIYDNFPEEMSLNQSLTTTVGGNWEPLKVFEESSDIFLSALGEWG